MRDQTGSASVYIAAAILAVITGALSVVAWKNFIEPRTMPNSSTASTPVRNDGTSQTPIKDETSASITVPADWALYEGNSLPVNFRYPTKWEIADLPSGANVGALRAFVGDRQLPNSVVLGVLYRKDSKSDNTGICNEASSRKMLSCESYDSKIITGALKESEDGKSFIYDGSIGNDVYTFNSYNNSVSKLEFKAILNSISLR